MLFANNIAILSKLSGAYDEFGQEAYLPGVPVPCAVVSLADTRQVTPVRSELSASHANADEDAVKGTVLFPTSVAPAIGNALTIQGINLRIQSVQPRYDTFGGLDHWECKLEALP